MACDCKDANGSLMEKCLGTCRASIDQQYFNKLIDFDNGIHELLREFKINLNKMERDMFESFNEVYFDGFRKGFEMAKEIYE